MTDFVYDDNTEVEQGNIPDYYFQPYNDKYNEIDYDPFADTNGQVPEMPDPKAADNCLLIYNDYFETGWEDNPSYTLEEVHGQHEESLQHLEIPNKTEPCASTARGKDIFDRLYEAYPELSAEIPDYREYIKRYISPETLAKGDILQIIIELNSFEDNDVVESELIVWPALPRQVNPTKQAPELKADFLPLGGSSPSAGTLPPPQDSIIATDVTITVDKQINTPAQTSTQSLSPKQATPLKGDFKPSEALSLPGGTLPPCTITPKGLKTLADIKKRPQDYLLRTRGSRQPERDSREYGTWFNLPDMYPQWEVGENNGRQAKLEWWLLYTRETSKVICIDADNPGGVGTKLIELLKRLNIAFFCL